VHDDTIKALWPTQLGGGGATEPRVNPASSREIVWIHLVLLLALAATSVALRLLAPVVALRHEHFPAAKPEFRFPPLHVSPYGCLGDWLVGLLLAQSRPDPVRRGKWLLPRAMFRPSFPTRPVSS